MKHLTVRNLPPAIAEALDRERRRRGASLNQTVIELLEQSLGVAGTPSNGLGRFAGRWSDEDFREFQEAVAGFDTIDAELWG